MNRIEKRMKIEKERMSIEKKVFGRYLLVCDGENEIFWKRMRKLSK